MPRRNRPPDPSVSDQPSPEVVEADAIAAFDFHPDWHMEFIATAPLTIIPPQRTRRLTAEGRVEATYPRYHPSSQTSSAALRPIERVARQIVETYRSARWDRSDYPRLPAMLRGDTETTPEAFGYGPPQVSAAARSIRSVMFEREESRRLGGRARRLRQYLRADVTGNPGLAISQEIARWRAVPVQERTSGIAMEYASLISDILRHHAGVGVRVPDILFQRENFTRYISRCGECGRWQPIPGNPEGWSVEYCPRCRRCYNDEDEDRSEQVRDSRESGQLALYGATAYALQPLPEIITPTKKDYLRMGFELELEHNRIAGSVGKAAWRAVAAMEDAGLPKDSVGAEGDGSLNYGAEFVFTHGTFASWDFKLQQLHDTARDLLSMNGFRREETCGVHIHVSPVPSLRVLARVTRLLNHQDHERFIRQVCGRSWGHYRTKAPVELIATAPADHTEDADNLRLRFDRYQCVAITEKPTVEIRIFAATESFDTMRRYLQFTDAAFRWAKGRMKWENAAPKGFCAFVMKEHRRYPVLARYLRRHFPALCPATKLPLESLPTTATTGTQEVTPLCV